MSSREVMEDDPDRWYKMVLEDEEAIEQEQRARAREQIVEGFEFMTYETGDGV